MPTRIAESPSAAVDRALGILENVAQSAAGLTNSEISRRLEIPKSSASYILRTLERRGYLARDAASGKYRLGLKVLALGRGVHTGMDLRKVALPFLQQLVDRTHLTCHLAILDAGEAVYIEKVEAPGFIKMDTWIGRRMYVHSTSVGKSLVAWLPAAEIDGIIREHGLPKRTAKTITVGTRLLKELEKVRAQGYSVDDEENSPGARCVGAPVFDSLAHAVAAIGLSGTTGQVTHENLPKLADSLKETARKISRQLGFVAMR
ncbi:MAG: IclR family transcriptional regulator [Acidobacteria bacterium]|nr:IclR family transcriptional regulator [Acidobacteriota bacterium]